MMNIQPGVSVEYSLPYKEFAAGYRLGARQNFLVLLFYVLTRYVASILAVFITALFVMSLFDGQRDAAWHMLPLVLLVDLVPLINRWQQRTSFNRLRVSKSSDPNLRFTANDKEFSREVIGMGELKWRWSATQGISHNKTIVVISVSKGCFIFIPRRVLTDTELTQFQQMQQLANHAH